MKKILALIVALLLVFSLVACGNNSADTDADESADSGETANSELKACMISTISQGTPFGALEWDGLSKVSELGYEDVKFIEALDSAEYEEQIRSMAEAGYSPIFCQFDALNAYVLELADEYPDTYFYLCDSALDISGHDNVCSLIVDPAEGAFIAGYVAAKTSQTGTIGWVGSLDQANINRYRYGYEAGAMYANPDIEILTGYTGSNTDSAKGQEIANSFISQNADVIAEAANLSGLGAIAACTEAGIKAIGCDSYMSDEYESVFWSALKDIDMTLYNCCKEFAEGTFVTGERNFTLATGARAFDDRDYQNLSEELKAEVDKIVEDIVNGTIDIAAEVAKVTPAE